MGFVKEELLEILLCGLNVLSTFKKHLQRANNHNRGSWGHLEVCWFWW